ncbi:endo-1,4-beta-xylanase [Streptomyces sp. S1D4-11]
MATAHLRRDETGHRRRVRRLPLVAVGALVAATAVALPQFTPDAKAATTLRGYADGRGVKIGAAVGDGPLTSDSGHTAVLDREFNSVTAENAMKWDALEPTRGSFNWAAADRLVAHASAHNQGVRGHTLAWYAQLPSWLKNGNFSASELNTILKGHIGTKVGRYKGKVYAWDVVNEAFSGDGSMRGSLWPTKLGTGYIANALRWAHAADPAANLKRFSDLGLEVSVTELDVRIPLPASSAQQSADYKPASLNPNE